tara:strand:- start:1021 stop:1263 length:243 start_codon:yes stop_codon:yes gene_type:complete
MKKYTIKKDTFFNYYFKSTSKEDVASFLAPHLMALATKDVYFSLEDLLKSIKTVPSYLLEDYSATAKVNAEIDTSDIKLI